MLSYPQKVVVVKSGEKQKEKEFLGYEFSSRKWSEGIHPIQRWKPIDECTKLFDPEIFDNPDKASTYIYDNFQNNFERVISEELKDHIFRVNLVDLLTFDRADFEKTISLNKKTKVRIESKRDLVKLDDVLVTLEAGNRPKWWVWSYTNGVPSLWWEHIWLDWKVYLHEANIKFVPVEFFEKADKWRIQDNDILICKDWALTWKIALFDKSNFDFPSLMINEHVFLLRVNKNNNQKYLFTYLFLPQWQELLKSSITGQAQWWLNRDNLLNIKIPLPPKDIQQKIVDEIWKLDWIEERNLKKIWELEESIRNNISNNSKLEKLENIAVLIKRWKAAKYWNSNIQIIKSWQARWYRDFDFSENYFVNEWFVLDERKLQKWDVLINSTWVWTAWRVTLFDFDGDFVVDSHITIVRLDLKKAVPPYVLYSLANIWFKTIEKMAEWQSGQIELSLWIINNLKIPLPPLETQKQIVAQIEKIEQEIEKLKSEIAEIPNKKEEILRKYL